MRSEPLDSENRQYPLPRQTHVEVQHTFCIRILGRLFGFGSDHLNLGGT